MKLWHLTPKKDWQPWYDRAFAFVVRADNEQAARKLVNDSGDTGAEGKEAWLNPKLTDCDELVAAGEPEVVICDFARA